MTPRKLSVLVYNGIGSTESAVRHALFTLRHLLTPHYAVETISENVILEQPWHTTCALLVFPGGADMGYCRALNGKGNDLIKQYVKRGGSYLGFCAGGYYGSAKCEFEVGTDMEVVGKRELAFFPGICRGLAFKGFKYGSEDGARAAKMMVNKFAFQEAGESLDHFPCYYNGGGVFVDAEKFRDEGVEMLAQYEEPIAVDGGDRNERAAVVYCKVGDGHAVLTGVHPEFSGDNLSFNISKEYAHMARNIIFRHNKERLAFMRGLLGKLGLRVSNEVLPEPLLSSLHVSSLPIEEASNLLARMKKDAVVQQSEIEGESDTFRLQAEQDIFRILVKGGASSRMVSDLMPSMEGFVDDITKADPLASDPVDFRQVEKKLIFHPSEPPSEELTPYFDHYLYYASLLHYQSLPGTRATSFGRTVIYGERVSSTNTMLEKNPRLLKHLSTGTTAVATTQVAGRGRGTNAWISPPGQLIFSVLLRHPYSLNTKAPAVFIQYLAAIAVAEGIRTYHEGYEDMPVKLKWPNDIYALDPDSGEYVKIGGILVNTSFVNNNFDLVVGIGINVSNSAPTTSLNAVRPEGLEALTIEKCLARILTSFEDSYARFREMGFDRLFEERYYRLWLHSGQIVTLEAEGGARAKVVGITNWGQLKVEELGWEDRPTGKVWELMTDSNSFDFFRGLVKAKN